MACWSLLLLDLSRTIHRSTGFGAKTVKGCLVGFWCLGTRKAHWISRKALTGCGSFSSRTAPTAPSSGPGELVISTSSYVEGFDMSLDFTSCCWSLGLFVS